MNAECRIHVYMVQMWNNSAECERVCRYGNWQIRRTWQIRRMSGGVLGSTPPPPRLPPPPTPFLIKWRLPDPPDQYSLLLGPHRRPPVKNPAHAPANTPYFHPVPSWDVEQSTWTWWVGSINCSNNVTTRHPHPVCQTPLELSLNPLHKIDIYI